MALRRGFMASKHNVVESLKQQAIEDPLLGVSEVAQILGKALPTIERWCLDGLLPFTRMPSNRLGIRLSAVQKILTIINPDSELENDGDDKLAG